MLRTRCYICNTGKKTRYKRRIGNGTYQVVDICNSCKDNFNGAGINIPHRLVDDLEALPLLADYTQQIPPCEVCGSSDGVEYHHYAPRHIFGKAESERYPKGYLCRSCHRDWHIGIASHNQDECRYCKGLAGMAKT